MAMACKEPVRLREESLCLIWNLCRQSRTRSKATCDDLILFPSAPKRRGVSSFTFLSSESAPSSIRTVTVSGQQKIAAMCSGALDVQYEPVPWAACMVLTLTLAPCSTRSWMATASFSLCIAWDGSLSSVIRESEHTACCTVPGCRVQQGPAVDRAEDAIDVAPDLAEQTDEGVSSRAEKGPPCCSGVEGKRRSGGITSVTPTI